MFKSCDEGFVRYGVFDERVDLCEIIRFDDLVSSGLQRRLRRRDRS